MAARPLYHLFPSKSVRNNLKPKLSNRSTKLTNPSLLVMDCNKSKYNASVTSLCDSSANAVTEFITNPILALPRSEEHTSELQSRFDLVCRLLLEKKKKK